MSRKHQTFLQLEAAIIARYDDEENALDHEADDYSARVADLAQCMDYEIAKLGALYEEA